MPAAPHDRRCLPAASGYTTIAIGVLGFLGLGLPPPDPDWGGDGEGHLWR